MLQREELMFDPLDVDTLVERLTWAWELTDFEYDEIVSERCVATRALASEEAYYEGLMTALEDAINRHRGMSA